MSVPAGAERAGRGAESGLVSTPGAVFSKTTALWRVLRWRTRSGAGAEPPLRRPQAPEPTLQTLSVSLGVSCALERGGGLEGDDAAFGDRHGLLRLRVPGGTLVLAEQADAAEAAQKNLLVDRQRGRDGVEELADELRGLSHCQRSRWFKTGL